MDLFNFEARSGEPVKQDDVTLEITNHIQTVHSHVQRPDRDWQFTDDLGHVHWFDHKGDLPSLVWVWDDGLPDDADVDDADRAGRYRCKQCGQDVYPAYIGEDVTDYILTGTTYLVNGQPVSQQQAQDTYGLICRIRQQRGQGDGSR